jgi:hypothetical protein
MVAGIYAFFKSFFPHSKCGTFNKIISEFRADKHFFQPDVVCLPEKHNFLPALE